MSDEALPTVEQINADETKAQRFYDRTTKAALPLGMVVLVVLGLADYRIAAMADQHARAGCTDLYYRATAPLVPSSSDVAVQIVAGAVISYDATGCHDKLPAPDPRVAQFIESHKTMRTPR